MLFPSALRSRNVGSPARLAGACAAIALVFVSTLVASAHAAPVACGSTVTADVALTSDLVCPSGVGLIVAAGVTVDFAGHTLSGAGTGDLGVVMDGGSARLRNGRVEGFRGEGVSASVANATLEKMVITGNGAGVLNFPGAATITSSSITANAGDAVCCYAFHIRDTTIARNGDGITTVQGLDMSGSTVSGNGGHGIRARASGLSLADNGVSLSDNVLVSTDVSIFTTVDRITITGNRLVNSALAITDGNVVTLNDNVFLSNNSPFGSRTISIAPNGGYPSVYVARNRLVNQPLVVGDPLVTVVDGGGNTGNRCGTLLVCGA